LCLGSDYVFNFSAAESQNPIPDINADAVFANNETKLSDIEVYGFDYDYTLATYKRELHDLIYDLGREALVSLHKVSCFPPPEIEKMDGRVGSHGNSHVIRETALSLEPKTQIEV
jgi:hypothetical protein